MEITEIKKLSMSDNTAAIFKCFLDAKKLNEELLTCLYDYFGEDEGDKRFYDDGFYIDEDKILELLTNQIRITTAEKDFKEL